MFNQYIFLKEQSSKLIALQQDYSEHLMHLNAIITDFQKNTDTESEEVISSSDEKKNGFLVVNRSQEHLEASLEKYLIKNNLSKERQLLKKNRLSAGSLKQRKLKARRFRGSKRKISRRLILDIPRQIEHDISFDWPLELSCFWISSYFGPRKKANGAPGFHYGIDLAAPRGTAVKAAAAGEIVEAGYSPGYGNTVVVRHTKKYRTRYAHLNSINVKIGDIVERGQKIGRVGNTGHIRSSGGDGSHLHFEVMVSNRKINPLWILPRIS